MQDYQASTKVCPRCFGTMRRFDESCKCGYVESKPLSPLEQRQRLHSETEQILQARLKELGLDKRGDEDFDDYRQRCKDAMPEGYFKKVLRYI